jgi:hypothetical protein
LDDCALQAVYVTTNGSISTTPGACKPESFACGTINSAVAAAEGRGTVIIIGNTFTNGNSSNPGNGIIIPEESRFEFTTNSEVKASLMYYGTSLVPFFTVTTGEVTFSNLTIVFSSANMGEFLLLEGFIIFIFILFLYRKEFFRCRIINRLLICVVLL